MVNPDWFPDWRGSVCAIVAGGESATRDDVALLRGRAKVIVINRSHELAPWADVLYGADRLFWDKADGVKEFAGLRVTQDRDVAKHFRLRLVSLVATGHPLENSLSLEPGILARGGHSGHQALNLAFQFGARRIILLGYDFKGEHWHGKHEAPLRNPRESTLAKWAQSLDALASVLAALGVDVINCSERSALTAYRKMTVEGALELWRAKLQKVG